MANALLSGATEIVSAVTSKGQVTLPAAVRRHLGIGRSDRVSFVIESDGTVRLRAPRYRSVRALRGAAGTLGRRLTWEEMRRVAYEDRLEAGQGVQGTEESTAQRDTRG